MKSYTKELLLLCIPVVLAFFSTALFFGYAAFQERKAAINIHDTYFVTSIDNIIICEIIIFGFILYFFRHLQKNSTIAANFVFLFFNSLLIVLFTYLIAINESYSIPAGEVIYPPLSSPPQKIEEKNFITSTFNLAVLQFILIVLLIYKAFKTGKKFKL